MSRAKVELRELCRYAQNNRGGTVFYDRFVYLCKLRGVTPSRAAIDAGISKSLVTKWKSNNIQDPSPDVLRKLAAYFNITIAELLGEETENPQKNNVPDELVLTEDEIRILRAFREMSHERQKALADLLGLDQK